MPGTVRKERVQQLVDALRSGKYKQSTTYLRLAGSGPTTTPRMCVLGVACEVSGVGQWGPVRQSGWGIKFRPYETDDEAEWQVLPRAVKDWYGFYSTSPYVTAEGESHSLVILNDHGYSFQQLADLIEKEFL